MNHQTPATNKSNKDNLAVAGNVGVAPSNSPNSLNSAHASACRSNVTDIDDGRVFSSVSHSSSDANAVPTKETVSPEGHPNPATDTTHEGDHKHQQVEEAQQQSKSSIFTSLMLAGNDTSTGSNPQDDSPNRPSAEAFRPRKKEIHYLSDVFLQDFRDLLTEDFDSDDDSDAEHY